MNLTLLPKGEMPPARFTRPAGVKTDTHYLFTNGPYTTEVIYHSSMFYGPVFFRVSVKNQSGATVWSGGDAMFLDTLFLHNFISETHHRLILTRVNSTENSGHMQPLMVDLLTGRETLLDAEGFYHSAGHFMNFDGVFYSVENDIKCIDYERQYSFFLFEILRPGFPHLQSWGVSPVKNCVLVFTQEAEGKICLFNLHTLKTEQELNLDSKLLSNCRIQFSPLYHDQSVYISIFQTDKEQKPPVTKARYAKMTF
jgi:hypothetical protein